MAYATVDQLAAALRTQVTAKNSAQLQDCLDAASEEIDHQLGRPVDAPLPDPPPDVVSQTCVARAVEWWKASDAAFGALGFDGTGVLTAPKDAFARHAANLIPYQATFGIA
jgi:hypothetical protein